MIVNESYTPKAMTASGVVIPTTYGGALGGFFCTVAGTLALTETVGGATIVEAFAVAVGTFYTLPFASPPGVGITATLGGGAHGTFGLL